MSIDFSDTRSVFAPKTIKIIKTHEKHAKTIYIDYFPARSVLESTIVIFKNYESSIFMFQP